MIGGELLGKLIILSFRDDEEALFSKAISALSSVADFSTVAASADTPLLFGSVQIDPQRRLVWQAGQTVELTPMEFDILLLLARRPGQVFTARQIYEAVAADSFGASWTGISSMVYKLRRKLGAGIIETVRGHGYRMRITNRGIRHWSYGFGAVSLRLISVEWRRSTKECHYQIDFTRKQNYISFNGESLCFSGSCVIVNLCCLPYAS